MKFKYVFFSTLICCFIGCTTNQNQSMNPTNLIDYGVPITILAPDSIVVEQSKLGFQDDITIQFGSDFQIQLFVSETSSGKLEMVRANQLNAVQTNTFFNRMVTEDDDGFLFENKVDSTHSSYGFRHIRVMGSKEYVFQEAMIGSFTEEQARSMYEAVRYTK